MQPIHCSSRVLVTGAGGFIGRWSVQPLLSAGCEVHAVVGRAPTGSPGDELPGALRGALRGAHLHYVDLLDESATDALAKSLNATHLLHFAWIATPRVYWTSPDNSRWLAASQALLRSFYHQGGKRVVMAGSCAEYDWSTADVCQEDSTPLADHRRAAASHYAECKIALSRALEEFGRSHGLSTAWGRIFFQFGPDEHPERLVSSVILNLLGGNRALASHGRQIRSFLDTRDVAAAFAALLLSKVEGAVNIGSARALSIGELLGMIAVQIGRPDLLELGGREASPLDPPVLLPCLVRLHEEVGWQPRLSLEDGIEQAIDWWRSHR